LRIIAKVIADIKTHEEKYYWITSINYWILKYGNLLKEKTIGVNTKKKWWYTHGNTRRAIKLLTLIIHSFQILTTRLRDQIPR